MESVEYFSLFFAPYYRPLTCSGIDLFKKRIYNLEFLFDYLSILHIFGVEC